MSDAGTKIESLVHKLRRGEVDRREFLRRAAALGISTAWAGSFLAACGGGGGDSLGGTETTAGTAPETTAGTAVETAPLPTELKLLIPADITTLDPAFLASGIDAWIMGAVFEGLVTYEPGTLNVVNQLAEVFEPAADGLSFDFKLQEGVQFHGGYGEVTADDVKFSYERIAGLTEPKIESPYANDWATLAEVRVADTYSGTIVLKEAFAPMLNSTLPVTSGLIVSKKAALERGKDFGTSPIGSGPFEFARWTPMQRVSLTRFQDYRPSGEKSQWERIDFVVIADEAAGDIALEAGEVDFAQIPAGSVGRFQANDDFKVDERQSLGYGWLGMNMLHPKLVDKRVREAVRYAVDVPSILEAVYEGTWTRATSIIPPTMPVGYWEEAPVYERDTQRATALLEEAGASSLELTLTYTDFAQAPVAAEIIQANLSDVGIDLRLEKQDSATFNKLGESLRERELHYQQFGSLPDPSFSTVWFTCEQLDQWNWIYWCDEEFDRLHAEGLRMLDRAERQDIYVQMQTLWDAAANTVWIGWPKEFYAFKRDLVPSIAPFGGQGVVPQAFRSA